MYQQQGGVYLADASKSNEPQHIVLILVKETNYIVMCITMG